MAASGSGVTRLDDMIKCPICLDTYRDPRILPCFHTFCESCLSQLNTFLARITCPLCAQHTFLARSGTQGLPTDFKTNQLLEIVNKNRATNKQLNNIASGEAESESRRVCDIDKCHEEATICCMDCEIILCKSCKIEHLHRKALITLQSHVFCGSHPRRFLQVYCSSCTQSLCSICVHTHSKNHNFILAQDWVENIRKIQKEKNFLSKNLQSIQVKEAETENLTSFYDQLKDDSQRKVNENTENLIAQITELEARCSDDIDAIITSSRTEQMSALAPLTPLSEFQKIASNLESSLTTASPHDCIASSKLLNKNHLRRKIHEKLAASFPDKYELREDLLSQIERVHEKFTDDVLSSFMEFRRGFEREVESFPVRLPLIRKTARQDRGVTDMTEYRVMHDFYDILIP